MPYELLRARHVSMSRNVDLAHGKHFSNVRRCPRCVTNASHSGLSRRARLMSTGLLQDIGEGVICPAGAASKILSSGPAENISLHGLVETALCPSSITRGVSRSSRTWSGMRWTRRRFARDGIAGRVVFRWTCGGYSCATLPMQRLRVQRAPAFPTPSKRGETFMHNSGASRRGAERVFEEKNLKGKRGFPN